jgi:LytS/YehU family sensor histidine kinase
VEGDVTEQLIAPLLFIDFVENAFKHGIDKRFSDGFVHIHFKIEPEVVSLSVKNSIGTDEQSGIKQNEAGIGLFNVKKRLSLLYPQKHQLGITHDEEVFNINLQIELT